MVGSGAQRDADLARIEAGIRAAVRAYDELPERGTRQERIALREKLRELRYRRDALRRGSYPPAPPEA